METRLQQKLKICTGHDWREITQSYVDFRLRNNKSRPQMCVFTPDDITKQRARLFIPEDAHSHELHRPDVFLEKYLNVKDKLVRSMPWVQIDLAKFPARPIYYGYPDGSTLVGKLTFSGYINLRPKKSANNLSLSTSVLKTISVNAQLETASILRDAFNINFDIESRQLSISVNGTEQDIVTNLEVNFPKISAEITDRQTKFTYKGWDIIMNLSLSFEGELFYNHPSSNAMNSSEFWHEVKIITIGLLLALGIVALVFFTGGIGLSAVAAA